MDQETAQGIAIAALQHLAGDDDLLMRFSALTGILPNDMRQAAGEPGFLAGVLDFFLAHEPDLLEWTQAAGLNPETVPLARQTLAPEERWGME